MPSRIYGCPTWDEEHSRIKSARGPSLHLLVCGVSAISYESLRSLLYRVAPYSDHDIDPNLRIIAVPLSPPISGDQAKQLSQDYWPTTYKGGNPFGPHPAITTRATQEIQGQAEELMAVAASAGFATSAARVGEAIGAVAVSRRPGNEAEIVAAAGDARWKGIQQESRQGCGNAASHAVMRVINLVAQKRRSLLEDSIASHQKSDTLMNFVDELITPVEKDAYTNSHMPAGGYLCLDLELYVTHEPCVMCCMAINHSRFGRVIFGKSTATGGLGMEKRDSDGSDIKHASYGLGWRQDLNWKYLTWNLIGFDKTHAAADIQSTHA